MSASCFYSAARKTSKFSAENLLMHYCYIMDVLCTAEDVTNYWAVVRFLRFVQCVCYFANDSLVVLASLPWSRLGLSIPGGGRPE